MLENKFGSGRSEQKGEDEAVELESTQTAAAERVVGSRDGGRRWSGNLPAAHIARIAYVTSFSCAFTAEEITAARSLFCALFYAASWIKMRCSDKFDPLEKRREPPVPPPVL